MKRSFQYLLVLNVLPNLAIVAACAAALTGSYALSGGKMEFFKTYFDTLPVMLILIFFMLAFGLSTSNLQVALSFGARRRDYFWALQGAILTYTAGAAAIQTAASLLTGALNLPRPELLGGTRLLVGFPLACLALTAVGCMAGLLYVRSRSWGAVVMVSTMVLGVIVVVMFLLVINDKVGLWGDLPLILTALMICLLVVSELVLYRAIVRAVVK